MIPLTDLSWQGLSWQELLKQSISSSESLVAALNLPFDGEFSNFPVKVPMPYLSRIKPSDPNDPLLKQVLSTREEDILVPGFEKHPLQETNHVHSQGLIQKYQGRVLVVATGACGINCRYCFRRHFPYESFQPDTAAWQTIFNTIAADESIKEVILSGGDPLVMSDKRLTWISQQLNEIPHLTTLRVHSRMPVVIPSRVCDDLLSWLDKSRLKIVLVNHINHQNEIDTDVVTAMAALKGQGVTLLNQSVLLNGVNADLTTLQQLSERLFGAGILPYYLHLLDPVAGAAHFDSQENAAIELVSQLRTLLPGYLVPKLVREIPGELSKRAIF